MTLSRVRLPLFASLALILAPAAAHAGPKVEWQVVVPPSHILEGVHSVAMGEFSGTQADKLRDFMQAAIVGRTDAALAGLTTNVFKVSSSGADATLTATVSVPDPVVEDYTATESRYNTATKSSVNVTVYCRKREITVNVRVGVSGKDGTLLAQDEVGNNANTKLCKDSPELLRHAIDTGEFTTANNEVEGVLRGLAGGLVNRVMPYVTETHGELLVEKAVKDGNKDARDGKFQEAVDFWIGVINVDPYNASAHYNIGLAFEAQDDLDNAKVWYGKAGALQQKDEITQSLARVAGRQAQVAVLTQKYAMTHQPGVITTGGAAAPGAPPAQKVTVSGGKNARVALRAEAAEGGPPVVQLPGGMMLTVVEVDGDYVKVATVDGKEGYLLTKEVDGLK